MYEIRFENQCRQGCEDYPGPSICLSYKDYCSLPIIDSKAVFDEDCDFKKRTFFEQVRHPSKEFKSIWVSNPNWHLPNNSSNPYMCTEIHWVFVCISEAKNAWIAFKFWDEVDAGEAYTATVGVSFPRHGELYRLDNECRKIVKNFYL